MEWFDTHKFNPGKITGKLIFRGEAHCWLKDEYDMGKDHGEFGVEIKFYDIQMYFGCETESDEKYSLEKAMILDIKHSCCNGNEVAEKHEQHLKKLEFDFYDFHNISKFFDKKEFTYQINDVQFWAELGKDE